MNRQDWLDYFEAVNGRTPSPEEVAHALVNGEFIEEAVVSEVHPTQPPGVETVIPPVQPNPEIIQAQVAHPTQVSQQEAQTIHSTAFSQSQQGQQNTSNVQIVPSAYSSFLKQFWTWLVSAWKSPTEGVSTHQYNGYFAFFLLVFFASLTVFISSSKAVSGFNSLVNQFNTSVYDSGYYGVGVDISLFFKIFLAMGFIFFSIIFAGFVVRRFVYKEEKMTFIKSFEWYGRLFSINIFLFALASLLIFLNIYSLGTLVLSFNFLVLTAASTYAISNFDKSSKFDKFYQYLLGMLVNGIIIFIFLTIGLSILGDSIYNGLIGF